jgi:Putative peptidoglycan binding domain
MQLPPGRATMLPALITITLFITGFLLSVSITVEGNGKKSRRATAKSGKKSGKSTSKTARRGRRSRTSKSEPPPIASYQASPTYPDSIEVIEYGSSESTDLKKLLNMPNSSVTTNNGVDSTDIPTPTRRVSVKMDSSRVFEIQQALAGKGFYQGETTGNYDESTIDAMRRFQLKEKITVTGYPTAHALRRLGLTKW